MKKYAIMKIKKGKGCVKMENITLGQLYNFIITFAAVLTAGSVVCKIAFRSGKRILENSLKPFNKRIDEVVENNNKRFAAIEESTEKQFTAMQLQMDKNYLVRFLADVEEGTPVDETEKEHFWFTYDDYHKHNGNSYIDHKVEKLKKEGKL